MIVLAERFNPTLYLGSNIRIFLKTGGRFNAVVLSCFSNFVNCIDGDGLELTINIQDIDFVVDLGKYLEKGEFE
jgi:hypothetical protein